MRIAVMGMLTGSRVCVVRVCSVASVLSLVVAVVPYFSVHLSAPFLAPVIAIMTCSTSIGASVRTGWQASKGMLYASLFGYATLCQEKSGQTQTAETERSRACVTHACLLCACCSVRCRLRE